MALSMCLAASTAFARRQLSNMLTHLAKHTGWDQAKAYGFNDVFDSPEMGWSRYSHSMRVSVINRYVCTLC